MSRTSTYTLPVGGVVSTSFSIYFRNLPLLVVLATVILMPWIAARLWLATDPRSLGLVVLTALLQLGMGQVLTGAITYAVVQHLSGNRIGLQQAIDVGIRSFVPALFTGLAWGLAVGLGVLLLVIPGILVAVWFYPAVPACVVERLGVGAAFRRALALTDGSRWQVFGAILLMGIIAVFTFGIPAAIVAMLSGTGEEPPAWFEIALNLVMTPFFSLFPAVVYFLLRQGKENVDVKQLAAVFA